MTGEPERVQELLRAGADPNWRGRTGEPALVLAVHHCPSSLSMLLEAGADPNARAVDGTPVLVLAARHQSWLGYPLLRAGADPNSAGPDGEAVLAVALQRAPHLAWSLVNSGADVNVRSRRGVPSLVLALRARDSSLALRMLEMGADPRAASPDGTTPLMLSCRLGDPPIWRTWTRSNGPWRPASLASRLLDERVEMNVSHTSGLNALTEAIRSGNVSLVRRLLAAGVEVNPAARDSGALTHMAPERARPEVSRLLRRAGDRR
ncbi:MAG: ankyrin repeat domain-containing protein [Armatimonadota bacterium]